jgi:hypothetical protein
MKNTTALRRQAVASVRRVARQTPAQPHAIIAAAPRAAVRHRMVSRGNTSTGNDDLK